MKNKFRYFRNTEKIKWSGLITEKIRGENTCFKYYESCGRVSGFGCLTIYKNGEKGVYTFHLECDLKGILREGFKSLKDAENYAESIR